MSQRRVSLNCNTALKVETLKNSRIDKKMWLWGFFGCFFVWFGFFVGFFCLVGVFFSRRAMEREKLELNEKRKLVLDC